MTWWARFVSLRARAVVVLVSFFALLAGAGALAAGLPHDPDMFVLAPADVVASFREVNGRYGGLDVALVGIEGEVFEGSFVARLQELTRDLGTTPGVRTTLSLANVEDPVEDKVKGGMVVRYLLDRAPTSADESAALRARVLSRDAVVGNLVSPDGRAVMVLCVLAPDSDHEVVAAAVRERVAAAFPSERKAFHGAPFVASWVLRATERDLVKLGPLAGVALLLGLAVFLRRGLGVLGALSVAGGAVAVALAGLRLAGGVTNLGVAQAPLAIVLLGLPLGLVVAGARAPGEGSAGATSTVGERGTLALVASVAAAVALAPAALLGTSAMKVFAAVTAVGLLAAGVLAVVVPPALSAVFGRESVAPGGLATGLARAAARWTSRGSTILSGVGIVGLGLAGVVVVRLDTRVDSAALFPPSSPPAEAERFFAERFGGSQFVQIDVAADFTQPAALRGLVALADALERVPNVVSVQHAGVAIAKVNAAMGGDELLPDTQQKARSLYGFLEGKGAVRQLLTDDRTHAILQVRLAVSRAREVEPVLAEIRRLAAAANLPAAFIGPVDPGAPASAEQAVRRANRLATVLKRAGHASAEGDAVALAAASSSALAAAAPAIARYLGSDECMAEVAEGSRDSVAKALAAIDPRKPGFRAAITAALEANVPEAERPSAAANAKALERPLADLLQRERALAIARTSLATARVEVPSGDAGELLTSQVANALLDTEPGPLLVAAADGAEAFRVTVTGQPVLDEAFGRIVRAGCDRALPLAAVLLALVAFAWSRSLRSSLAVLAPAGGALVLALAGLALAGRPLDVGSAWMPSFLMAVGAVLGLSVTDAVRRSGAEPALASVGAGLLAASVSPAAFLGVLALCEPPAVRTLGLAGALGFVGAGLAAWLVTPLLAVERSRG
jgi:predicted RND superfamily exporter protein